VIYHLEVAMKDLGVIWRTSIYTTSIFVLHWTRFWNILSQELHTVNYFN
jgi:hypothetical protein